MRLASVVLVLLSTTDALIPQQQLRPQLPARLARSHPLVAAAPQSESTGSSIAASTVNLVKAIVGSGVLSLPVGIAAFSSSRKALIPALAMISVIGTLSAYCFATVGRVRTRASHSAPTLMASLWPITRPQMCVYLAWGERCCPTRHEPERPA